MTIELDSDVSRETISEFEDEYGTPPFDVSRETENDYSPPVGGVKTDDPDAPYGWTRAGTPRGRPGRKPGQKSGSGKSAGAPKAPQKKAPSKPPPARKSTQVDYRPALLNLTGKIIGGVTVTGLIRNNMTILADAAAASNGQTGVVELVNTLADRYALVASILDRVLTVGPYAEGSLSVLIMVGQILVNHKVLPPGLIPGTQAPESLVEAFVAKQMEESPDLRAIVDMLRAQKAPAQ